MCAFEKGMEFIMRKGVPNNLETNENRNYKIIAVDDEEGIINIFEEVRL